MSGLRRKVFKKSVYDRYTLGTNDYLNKYINYFIIHKIYPQTRLSVHFFDMDYESFIRFRENSRERMRRAEDIYQAMRGEEVVFLNDKSPKSVFKKIKSVVKDILHPAFLTNEVFPNIKNSVGYFTLINTPLITAGTALSISLLTIGFPFLSAAILVTSAIGLVSYTMYNIYCSYNREYKLDVEQISTQMDRQAKAITEAESKKGYEQEMGITDIIKLLEKPGVISSIIKSEDTALHTKLSEIYKYIETDTEVSSLTKKVIFAVSSTTTGKLETLLDQAENYAQQNKLLSSDTVNSLAQDIAECQRKSERVLDRYKERFGLQVTDASDISSPRRTPQVRKSSDCRNNVHD